MDEQLELSEAVDQYLDQEKMHHVEGRRGVENLCKLVSVLGYKDTMHFGQLNRDAYVGDLINFLEDNSGAIEAVIDWIKAREGCSEWEESINAHIIPQEDEEITYHYSNED